MVIKKLNEQNKDFMCSYLKNEIFEIEDEIIRLKIKMNIYKTKLNKLQNMKLGVYN